MNRLQANICLLAVTFCWSLEVVIESIFPKTVSPFATTCITSLIAASLLGAYFFKRISLAVRNHRSVYLRRILLLGVLCASYNVLFLVGTRDFDISTSVFTAMMTVVILPVLLLVMRRGVSARTWVSALFVLAGIAIVVFPAIHGADASGLGIMAIGCLIRAVFLVKLNDYAREHDPVTLSTGLLAVVAVLTFVPWFATDPLTFAAVPWTPRLIAGYFIFSYFTVAFATVMNAYAQRRASVAHATIIYSSETIFATLWATILPAGIVDTVAITPPLVAGCLLVVAGNLVEIFKRDSWRQGGQARMAESDTMIRTLHPFMVLLERLRSATLRNILLFAALLAVYLVIALPFKVVPVIPGFADIRPVYMLLPMYGIFFGIPGCLASATGNLICDILFDSLRISSIAGFIGNFLYPFLLYLVFAKLREKPFHLRTGRAIAGLVLSLAAASVLLAVILTAAVAGYYDNVDLGLFATTVIGNSFIFPLEFAIPFIILAQEEMGFMPLSRTRDTIPLLESHHGS